MEPNQGPLTTRKDDIDNVPAIHQPPIHRLPHEVLAGIFTALQPRRRSRHTIPFEVAMSHVCTYWRDITFGTPLLWINIDIYSIRSLECVSSYLTRSQRCPIDVRFDIWASDRLLSPEASGATILPLVDLVIQHSDRWKTLLVFTSHTTTTASILLKLADVAAPLLQRIRVMGDDGDNVEPPSGQILVSSPGVLTGGVPMLTTVQMGNMRCLPPLANVTTLHLRASHFSSSELNTHILSDLTTACPSLTTFSIHGNFRGDWIGENITMPSLRSLWFQNGDTLAAKFLATVSLPNLESLWLDCPQYRVIQVIDHSIPRPTFPALKYLTLQYFDFYASSQFAKAFPTITALHFSFCNPFHITFLKETLIEDDHSRWPNLDTLVFRTTRETHAIKFSKTLDEIVSERQRGNNPIRKLLLDKDILGNLFTADSLRARTNLDVLRPDNFDDPWWIMSHMDFGDRL
ncbi:hypothetical protein D9615_004688 [Tricholomella constricta]|uniref:F-box domain-containing protein n=1 Tax=Tricholomella constricta TaxID=117010 RepID=A0A8H5HC67_9AGAR|nr:hypothetical protein D9615_004688 [Tricholomella constricta]